MTDPPNGGHFSTRRAKEVFVHQVILVVLPLCLPDLRRPAWFIHGAPTIHTSVLIDGAPIVNDLLLLRVATVLSMAPELKIQGAGCHVLLELLLCFNFMCCTGGGGMNVALHAQAPASREMVVGSAVTMAGVRQALLSRDQRRKISGGMPPEKEDGGSNLADMKMGNVSVFYPFEYGGLHETSWDLVIIEGWFGMINAFIHEVRAISYPRPVTVLFYCLDPYYPGMPHVAALDVEGFLTNSESTRQFLLRSAPTALVPLAADTEAFPFHPLPPCPSGTVAGAATYRHSQDTCSDEEVFDTGGAGHVVYVGSAGLMDHKKILPGMLREAAPYGLDIYGSGWQNNSEFSGYWKGVLPEKNLAFVYGTALAVIGVTTDAQRKSGKINNRVYEALSVGAPLISDHFLALEATFGDAILYARSRGDVARHIETLLSTCRAPGQNRAETDERQRRRAMIENDHTWSHRIEDILSFAESLPGPHAITNVSDSDNSGGDRSEPIIARCSRQLGCLSLAIVVDRDLDQDVTFLSTFVPAVGLLGSAYRVTWWMTPTSWDGDNSEDRAKKWPKEEAAQHRIGGATFKKRKHIHLPRDYGCLAKYDLVWAAGPWGGTADRIVRYLVPRGGTTSAGRATTPRLAAQLTGLVLWGSLCNRVTDSPGDQEEDLGKTCPDYAGDEGLRWYDVIYCQTKWDHTFLTQQAFEGAVSDNLQQAWGYGTARKFSRNDLRNSDEKSAISGGHQLDVLVVGTDSQLPDMLGCFNVAGVNNASLAVLLPSGAIRATPVLTAILGVAGVDLGTQIDNLPQRIPFYIDGLKDGDSSVPLSTELLFIRNAGDADALVQLASSAANVVIMASGQLGTWATLLTASGANGRGRWAERAQRAPKFVAGNAGNDRDGKSRVRDMIYEQPGGWDSTFYSRRLVAGMTRALCLGRGNSRISLVRPASGDSVWVFGMNGARVTVQVLIEDFDVVRDGPWCITVQGRTALCVLQNEFTVDLLISSSTSETEWEDILTTAEPHVGERADVRKNSGEASIQATTATKRRQNVIRVEVATELRSNMYQDVLQRSKPFFLFLYPSARAISAFGGGATRIDHNEGLVVEWNETITPGGSGGTDSRGYNAFQILIDARDFLERGNLVELDVARFHG